MYKRKYILSFCTAFMALFVTLQSCSSINKVERGTALGSAAGGAIGALVGKKAGNPVIGATIGAAFGGTTGAFIGKKLTRFHDKAKPLYVIDGTPCNIKEAQMRLNDVSAEEIESVKVLSNNDAIAEFGNKGENGAIVITFKNARKS